ncbi:SusC/RagA family TonB-linked outer membrane protein [Aquirufa rosea]|uniref:TonB-dependent receptor n=1 Tax=Aquirufa rosea TaxID=2509241 RepID=A0A4Q1C166_9BACT|nr:TonB-dependent receptor [Aquirufa rosea]RXK50804.1 TonB-dependent receptor [Aquirufa rosea]
MKRKLLFSLGMMLLWIVPVLAQDQVISGKVSSSEDGSALPGVSVSIKGSSRGITTGSDGSYRLSVPGKNAVLSFTFVGFAKQEVSVGNKTVIDVSLVPEASSLEEVVVIGYGTAKKQNLTGAQVNVSSKALENKPVTSFENLLQGKAAGVQVTAQNGRPGAPAFIRIRGEGTLTAGAQPLIVVDGVPTANSEGSIGSVNVLSSLNPNDIEDISVLKDASSAAIYGSRGANGVILVTTKKGKKGNAKVTLSTSYGINEKTPDNFQMMNMRQKLEYERDLDYANEYVDAAGITSPASASQADLDKVWASLESKKTDWFNTLLRKGMNQITRLGVSGASDVFTYNVSLENQINEGIFKLASDLWRKQGRVNVEFKPNNWAKIGTNINFSNIKTNEVRDRYNAQNPAFAIYAYNPYEPERLADGSFNLTHQGFPISEALENNPESLTTNTGLSSAYLSLTPIKNFEFRSQAGVTWVDYYRESYVKPNSVLDQYVGDPAARGSKTDNGYQSFNYVFSNTINYNNTIADKHNIRALVGVEYTNDNYRSFSFSTKGFPNGKVSTQDNASTPVSATSAKTDWALFSLFGRVGYDFNQKYFLDASIRRDGSSRFGVDNRYGLFGSVSAGWELTKESFMEDLTFVNQLKLRGSYGTSGNDRIGNYTSLGLYRYSSYGTSSATFPSQLPNPSLTWEKSASANVGIDFALLKNKLTGTVDYYQRKTSNLLFDRPVSSTTGFSSRTENVGAVENSGIELTLNYKIIQTKDLYWDISANFTNNNNKVLELTEDNLNRSGGVSKLKIGEPIDVYYLNRYVGVNKETGAPIYLDKNGSNTETWSAGDAVILSGKSRQIKYFGGLATSVTYKGVTLSADAVYQGGHYVLNYRWQDLTSDGENVYQNQAVDALNYWKKAGDVNVLPDPRKLYQSFSSDRFLQKGDYIRLRNVTVAYNLPSNWVKKAKMQSVRVYAQAQNWLYWAPEFKGDPEVGFGQAESTGGTVQGLFSAYSYPQTRTVNVGLDITF